MRLRIQYEKLFRCDAGCGTPVNRIGQTCSTCLIKAEQKDAARVLRRLKKRMDVHRYRYNEHGQPI